ERIKRSIREHAGDDGVTFLDATRLATTTLGNAIAANMIMLGFAWQKGRLPLSEAGLLRAIDLNGEPVAMNKAAFRLGRRAAVAPSLLAEESAPSAAVEDRHLSRTLDEIVARRVADLTAYQNEAYARRYAARVDAVRRAEAGRAPGLDGLAEAVARNLYKLMAVKDEYEVARLYTDGEFRRMLEAQFEAAPRVVVHLAPPLLARHDPATGRPKKIAFGPRIFPALRGLAGLKGLRGG
ncbi:DUF6537 domain-containing protein, partial [Nostoc sp. NIES-2111]